MEHVHLHAGPELHVHDTLLIAHMDTVRKLALGGREQGEAII